MDKLLWNIEDLSAQINRSESWIAKRIGPSTKLTPRIPTVPGMGRSFDPNVMRALFLSGSLKIEKSLITPLNVFPMREKNRKRL